MSDRRAPEYRESRCHACCKSPYGCARNFICRCHEVVAPLAAGGYISAGRTVLVGGDSIDCVFPQHDKKDPS